MAKKKDSIIIQLINIKEIHSTINNMLIEEINEFDNISPSIGISFNDDAADNNIFQVNCESNYEYNNEIIVQVKFSYTLEIEDLKNHMVGNNYKFSEEVWRIILSDVFCTARILISGKLVNTKIKDIYLPFGGQNGLIDNFKISNKKTGAG